MDLAPLSEAQIILNPDYGSGWYNGTVDGEFGIAGLQLFSEMAVEIVMQYEPDYDWETPYFEFYGVLPNHDWDNSYWYWLGSNSGHGEGRASNQVTFLIGPGTWDWDLAIENGETGVLVYMYGGVVTGMAWRYVPIATPEGGLAPGAAPELVVGSVSEATSQGTSPGPGARLHDEETASGQYLEQNARWWKVTPSESGWYVYDLASMSRGQGGTGWTWSSAYWYQGVPSENELPLAHSNYSHSKESAEAYGLVELQAGVTYYLRVMSRPGYGADPMWRVFFDRATWFCGHAGPDPFAAKEIANVEGFCSDPVRNYGFPAHWYYGTPHTAWWTFVAPKSGPFRASAMLTTKDGVQINQWWMYVRLFTNDPYWTGVQNPAWIDDINAFAGDSDEDGWEWVEEGRRYWLAVIPYDDYYDRPLEYVLQTQFLDHQVVQLDNEIVLARADGNIQPTTVYSPSEHFATTINPNSDSWPSMQSQGFQGYMELWRSFGGPQPGSAEEINNTWSCMWPKARLGQGGTWWWSRYNGVSWNGTDPYNGSIPGWGTCPVYVPGSGRSEQVYSDAPVGWHYHSEGGTYGQNYVRVWCHSQALGLHMAVQRLGPWAALTNDQINAKMAALGGQAEGFMAYYDRSYLPEGAEYGDDEFNSSVLVDVQVAPDEQGSQWANPGLAPPTEWYALKSRFTPDTGDSNAFPGWGPWQRDAYYELAFSAGSGGAESIAAIGDLVATYSGGASAWTALDWQEYWDYEEELMGRYAVGASDARGLFFVAMNAHHRSSAAPPTPPAMAGWDGPTVNHYVARLGQVMCVKLKLKTQPVLMVSPVSFAGSPGPIPGDCPWEWPMSSIDGDLLDGRRAFRRL